MLKTIIAFDEREGMRNDTGQIRADGKDGAGDRLDARHLEYQQYSPKQYRPLPRVLFIPDSSESRGGILTGVSIVCNWRQFSGELTPN